MEALLGCDALRRVEGEHGKQKIGEFLQKYFKSWKNIWELGNYANDVGGLWPWQCAETIHTSRSGLGTAATASASWCAAARLKHTAKLSTRFRGIFHNINIEKALSSSLLPKCLKEKEHIHWRQLWAVVNRAKVSESWKFCENINKNRHLLHKLYRRQGKQKL